MIDNHIKTEVEKLSEDLKFCQDILEVYANPRSWTFDLPNNKVLWVPRWGCMGFAQGALDRLKNKVK